MAYSVNDLEAVREFVNRLQDAMVDTGIRPVDMTFRTQEPYDEFAVRWAVNEDDDDAWHLEVLFE